MLGTKAFAHPAVLALGCIAAKTRESIIGELCTGRIAIDRCIIESGKALRISTPAMHGMQYRHFVQGIFILLR